MVAIAHKIHRAGSIHTLAFGHIAFAAAAPAGDPSQREQVETVANVGGTSLVSSGPATAENCFVEMQTVKSVRDKAMLMRTKECD